MNTTIKLIRDAALLGIIIIALGIFGNAVNGWLPFEYVTYAFTIVRNIMGIMNFTVDLDTFYKLIGWLLPLYIALWSMRATMGIVHWFREKQPLSQK